MFVARRWLAWAFISFVVFYSPILIYNNYYKNNKPMTPEELETAGDWYAEQRAKMSMEDIEKQRGYISTETSSPSFAAGSPLDRLQQHRNTQKMITGRWNYYGRRDSRNITAMQINNSSYYLVGLNFGDEIIIERGRCQITPGMIILLPDDGGDFKEVEFEGGNTMIVYEYGTPMEFVKK